MSLSMLSPKPEWINLFEFMILKGDEVFFWFFLFNKIISFTAMIRACDRKSVALFNSTNYRDHLI